MEYCRYRVEGILTTQSPLHVGSGVRIKERMSRAETWVSAVNTDVNDQTYIPATTLKGRLHQWADQSGADAELVRQLFGTGKEGAELGGRLIFHDALVHPDGATTPPIFANVANGSQTPLDWNATRMTYVMAGTALDRVTRTARENKLYHYEVVPPGIGFKVIIDGEGLTEAQLALFLHALDQFRHPGGLALGGMAAHGYGAMNWRLDNVTGLRTQHDLGNWLDKAATDSLTGFNGLPIIPESELQEIRAQANLNLGQGSECLTLGVEIYFDGPFMINDPSQAYKSEENPQESIDQAYLKNCQEKIVLTGKSLHGALRAQAERIVRTIAQGDVVKKACYIDSRDKAKVCKIVSFEEEIKDLCLTCRLLGGNGWRSPVTIPDFSPVNNGEGEKMDQEFVAIDRFTGGAAHEKQFNARYRYGPRLAGKLEVDLNRIEAKHAGLLILALRDLMEGDIPLGFGRSKGFGACNAKITGVTLPDPYVSWLEECLKENDCQDSRDELIRTTLPLTTEQGLSLQSLVEKFLTEVNSHAVL